MSCLGQGMIFLWGLGKEVSPSLKGSNFHYPSLATEKAPHVFPGVWENNVGVARTITTPIPGREVMAAWKYLALALTVSPLLSPSLLKPAHFLALVPALGMGHFGFLVLFGLVTQRSFAILHRVMKGSVFS